MTVILINLRLKCELCKLILQIFDLRFFELFFLLFCEFNLRISVLGQEPRRMVNLRYERILWKIRLPSFSLAIIHPEICKVLLHLHKQTTRLVNLGFKRALLLLVINFSYLVDIFFLSALKILLSIQKFFKLFLWCHDLGLRFACWFRSLALTIEASGTCHRSRINLPVNFLLHLLMLWLPLLGLLVQPLIALEVFFFNVFFANLCAFGAYRGFEVMFDLSLTCNLVACGFLIWTFSRLHSFLGCGN